MAEPITIVGGGLAGLALGIGLRQRGVPVTLWEAGRYPRHRVCGEFISGRGQHSLTRLGLAEGLRGAGVRLAKNAAFFSEGRQIPARALPEPAWCLSRFALDEWLAGEFSRLGGELRTGERWQGEFAPGVVRATGRRAEAVADGWRLFGLKIHAREVELTADLEMHFLPTGYVGLCRLAGGEVNICGLFRSETTVPELARRWREWLAGPPGSVLHERLSRARFDEDSFCSVAAISLRPRRALGQPECSVGDALTMIPPVTGNGMSMAFESAELALEPLTAFSQGRLPWREAQARAAAACDLAFARRLRWAARAQQALFHPSARSALLFLAQHGEWFWRRVFGWTR